MSKRVGEDWVQPLPDFASSIPPLPPVRAINPDAYVGPTEESNWVLYGRLLVGAYPSSVHDEVNTRILTGILRLGTTTFVCLQQEYQHDGVKEHEWRSGYKLRPYIFDAIKLVDALPPTFFPTGAKPEGLEFVHFPIVDCSIANDASVLQLAHDLVDRLARGENMYLHCWGGHGRTGTVVSIMLGLVYGITPIDAMRWVQFCHDLRIAPMGTPSPQTEAQRQQVIRILNTVRSKSTPARSVRPQLMSPQLAVADSRRSASVAPGSPPIAGRQPARGTASTASTATAVAAASPTTARATGLTRPASATRRTATPAAASTGATAGAVASQKGTGAIVSTPATAARMLSPQRPGDAALAGAGGATRPASAAVSRSASAVRIADTTPRTSAIDASAAAAVAVAAAAAPVPALTKPADSAAAVTIAAGAGAVDSGALLPEVSVPPASPQSSRSSRSGTITPSASRTAIVVPSNMKGQLPDVRDEFVTNDAGSFNIGLHSQSYVVLDTLLEGKGPISIDPALVAEAAYKHASAGATAENGSLPAATDAARTASAPGAGESGMRTPAGSNGLMSPMAPAKAAVSHISPRPAASLSLTHVPSAEAVLREPKAVSVAPFASSIASVLGLEEFVASRSHLPRAGHAGHAAGDASSSAGGSAKGGVHGSSMESAVQVEELLAAALTATDTPFPSPVSKQQRGAGMPQHPIFDFTDAAQQTSKTGGGVAAAPAAPSLTSISESDAASLETFNASIASELAVHAQDSLSISDAAATSTPPRAGGGGGSYAATSGGVSARSTRAGVGGSGAPTSQPVQLQMHVTGPRTLGVALPSYMRAHAPGLVLPTLANIVPPPAGARTRSAAVQPLHAQRAAAGSTEGGTVSQLSRAAAATNRSGSVPTRPAGRVAAVSGTRPGSALSTHTTASATGGAHVSGTGSSTSRYTSRVGSTDSGARPTPQYAAVGAGTNRSGSVPKVLPSSRPSSALHGSSAAPSAAPSNTLVFVPSRPTAAVRTGGTLPASVAATGSGAAASRTPVTARTRAVVHSRTAGGSSGVMSPAGAATANMTSPAAPTRAPTATSAASASRVITSVAAPVRPAVSAHTPAPPARATSPRQLARPGAGSSPRAGAHLSASTAYSDAMRASTMAAASLPAAASASSTEPTQRLTEKEIRGIVAASQEAMKALSAGSSLASNRSAHAASAPAPAHAHGSPSLQELLSSLLPSQPPTAAHSNSGSHLLQGVRPAK